jgi:hypothetical protein
MNRRDFASPGSGREFPIFTALIVASVACLSNSASAQGTITGLNNTGLPSASTLDANYHITTSPDLRFVTGVAATVVENPPGGWAANNSTTTLSPPYGLSEWIAPYSNESELMIGSFPGPGYNGPGIYQYQTTFTVTDTAIASISGQWFTDNVGVSILLNGEAIVGASCAPAFSAGTDFSAGTSFNIYSVTSSGTASSVAAGTVTGPATFVPGSFMGTTTLGLNTLTFTVNNIGSSPTGLQVVINSTTGITGLYGTGNNTTGTGLQSLGTTDPNYKITWSSDPSVPVSNSAYIVHSSGTNAAWLSTSSSSSSWIAPQADQLDAEDSSGSGASLWGFYQYQTTFNNSASGTALIILAVNGSPTTTGSALQ